jgi:hypothetical protein
VPEVWIPALKGGVSIIIERVESNRILGVSTAQWRQVDLQTQLQTTRLDAEGADRRCFGIEQSIFAAPHTPRIRLLSKSRASFRMHRLSLAA